ncbi:peptidoglycan-binding protein [Bombella intestini]|uniref:peptidoglycan-binding protein n=1 Tax=Bombella intestini TaxID=1539051 RepID=UPI000987BF76|nr:peptidoglycan-binding protein [Bombella intestini]
MSKENADLVLKAAMDSGITSRKELANFMGQVQVESGNFQHLEENLHYSPERLLELFSDRGVKTLGQAHAIVAGGTESIGNAVYGGEWGQLNGNPEPGDGYKYHGRGFIQLTGRENYRETGQRLNMDLVNHPDDAAKPEIAAKVAVDYWRARVVSKGQQEDITLATKIINGGYNSLSERMKAVHEWEARLEMGYKPGMADPLAPTPTLRQGSHGSQVSQVQNELRDLGYMDKNSRPLAVTGKFDSSTKQAVETFQTASGLKADGIIGPATRHRLDEAHQTSQSTKAATPDNAPAEAKNRACAPEAKTSQASASSNGKLDEDSYFKNLLRRGQEIRQTNMQSQGATQTPEKTRTAGIHAGL